MAFLVPLVLALVPLAILPGSFFYFDVTPKVALLLWGAAIALLFFRGNAAAVASLLSTRAGRCFVLLLSAQVISLILATALSSDPALSFGGTNWRRLGFVTQSAIVLFTFLIAAHCASNKEVVRRSLWATALAGCLAAAYAILQYFGWDPLLQAETYHAGEGAFRIVRPPATLGHASYLATYLVFALFAALALAGRHRNLRWTACVVVPIGILMSGTRAALLGLAAGLIVLAVLKRPRWRQVAAVGAFVSLGFAGLLVSPAGERLRARVRWSIEDVRGGSRLWLWRDSLRMASAHPLTGTGLETFSARFPTYQSLELAQAYPDFYSESPHNVFLDVLTSQGLPGVAVLLALCTLAAVRARSNPPLFAGLVAGVVSLQFTSFTVATFIAFLSFAAIALRDADDAVVAEPRRVWRSVPVLLSAVLAIAGLRLAVSDWRLRAVKAELDAGRSHAAGIAYQSSVLWSLPGGSADLYYSRRTAALQNWSEALAAGKRATRTAEDPQNAWYSLAAIYAAVGDGAAVERSLGNAIRIAPNWFKPHWTLAELHLRQGRLPEAEQEAAVAARLSGSKYPEVLDTLRKIRRRRSGA